MPKKYDLALETNEVDGSVLADAVSEAGRQVGEVSDDDVDRILDEIEEVDRTREIDVQEVREKHLESS